MITLTMPQGSADWHAVRLGIPTSSNFGKILTSTGSPSKQQSDYINKLIAESLAGKPVDQISNEWMERGTELEAEARLSYEIQTGNDVRQVGFVFLDDRCEVGCSPDGLVEFAKLTVNGVSEPGGISQNGNVTNLDMTKTKLTKMNLSQIYGGLEIKCPKAATLVSYYGKGCPAKYYPQIQGQMWICNLGWVDFYGYHPDLPPYLFRVERDEVYISSLAEEVEKFNDKLYQRKKELEI